MTTWLLPPRSGATFTNSAGNVYTGTVGVPVSFADSDVAGALAQGWTFSNTAPLEQLGALTGIPASMSLDTLGNMEGLRGVPFTKVSPINGRGNRVILLGDSITANCGPTFNTDGGSDGRSWFSWANYFAGSPLFIVRNAGIAGNTTANVLSRLTTDVFPFDADRIVLMIGTNDLGVIPVSQSKNNFLSIVDRLISAGYGVDVIIPPPRTWTLPAQAASLSAQLELFNYQRNIATTKPGCRLLLDSYSVLVNPSSASGDWLDPTTSMDVSPFVHPNNKGAALMGLAFFQQLLNAYQPPSVLPVSTAETNANTPFELFSDPLMLAATVAPGGSFTGLVPSGWASNTLTGGTCSCAVVASNRGIGNDIEFTITATGAGSLAINKTWSSALQNAFLANGAYNLRYGGAVQIVSQSVQGITSAYWSIGFGSPRPLSGSSLFNPSVSASPLTTGVNGKIQTQTSGNIPINATLTNAGVFGGFSQLLANVTWSIAGTYVVRFTAPFVRVIQ